jgi:methionyl aminopeptidase
MWQSALVAFILIVVGIASWPRIMRAAPPSSRSDKELADEARSLAVILDGIFDRIEAALQEGLTTRAIDELVQREISAAGVRSSFVGYHGYPAHCSASINEEVANTIPSDRPLRSGDLLKLQVGIAGQHTFAIRGWTYAIGETTAEDKRLLATGRLALERAVAAARTGARTGDIGHAIQSTAEEAGYSIDRTLIGYRIGTAPHQDPPVPGYGRSGIGARLKPDWVLSLFAIVHAGEPANLIAEDGWNAIARDGRRSVLFSHMVLVRSAAGELLTRTRK